MSEHTPGPWIGFVDKGQLYAVMPAGRSGDVCTFRISPREADGRLMIAAPDLLDALKGLVGLGDEGFMFSERIEKARAAITKATGE